MLIQLIIFITKNKIFAREINNDGKADAISIKGNPDIKCEGKESVDELIECIFEAFSIDSFGDDHFDIVIVDCGGDKNVIAYATEKCADADTLSLIGIEKLLPLIVWNKSQLLVGEEIVAAFDDACYKVACDDNNIVKYIGKARKGKENITLDTSDFGCLYYFNVGKMKGGVVDTKALQEKDDIIEKLLEEKDTLAEALSSKEKSLATLQKQIRDAKEQISALNAEKAQWEKDHPKASSLVEQMVRIVEKCKNSVDDLGGDLYIKGSIPKKKLDSAIELFKQGLKIKINKDSVVALYFIHDNILHFKNLLITDEFFCYDSGDFRGAKIIKWGDLVNVTEGDEIAGIFPGFKVGKYMDIVLNSGKYECIPICSEKAFVIGNLLIPMINQLKDVDVME